MVEDFDRSQLAGKCGGSTSVPKAHGGREPRLGGWFGEGERGFGGDGVKSDQQYVFYCVFFHSFGPSDQVLSEFLFVFCHRIHRSKPGPDHFDMSFVSRPPLTRPTEVQHRSTDQHLPFGVSKRPTKHFSMDLHVRNPLKAQVHSRKRTWTLTKVPWKMVFPFVHTNHWFVWVPCSSSGRGVKTSQPLTAKNKVTTYQPTVSTEGETSQYQKKLGATSRQLLCDGLLSSAWKNERSHCRGDKMDSP